ncbi:YoaK family protein [Dokdonella soli]|uniref:YoaK family protein n=1 Tax=Dokdonella soli TaxID=529810 RepID=A0ABN1ICQ0_9GAMM
MNTTTVQNMPASSNDTFVSTLMAFTAGFVDTCGFVALFGLFTAHVTGNFVLIGAALASPRPGILAKLLAFPVFMLVVAVTQAFLHQCKRTGHDPVRAVLLGQACFLALFLSTGVWASPMRDADAPLTVLIGMFGVAAMAIQNVASRAVFTSHAPTTVMTGNVTQTVMDAVDVAYGADVAPAKARLQKMLPPVFGFAVGAIVGGLGFAKAGFWCLALPLLAVLYVTWLYRRAR